MIVEKEQKREQRQIDSFQFRDRFQFVLYINKNVVCQRYFHINAFNPIGLESEEFFNVMKESVDTIKNDLESKSRICQWHSAARPTKLTGFVKDIDKYDEETRRAIVNNMEIPSKWEGHLTDGTPVTMEEKTYITDVNDNYNDRPADGEYTFTFKFLVDDRVVYESTWDGNVYPRNVRNGVDLSNSDIMYRDKDPYSLPSNISLIRHMTIGRSNIMLAIIKRICVVLSQKMEDYTLKTTYGSKAEKNEKTYYFSRRQDVYGWNEATKDKTRQYFSWVNNNIPQKKLDYIDRYK